ncbi:MAG: hypothetical protein ABH878_04740 [bacterium]
MFHHEGQTPGRNDHVLASGEYLQKKWHRRLICDDWDYLIPEGFIITEEKGGVLTVRPGREIQQWWEIIQQLLQLEKWESALQETEKLARFVGGEHAQIWEVRGICALNLGDLPAARQAFLGGKVLNPSAPGLSWGLMQILLQEGRSAEAQSGIQELILNHPQHERIGEWINTLKSLREASGQSHSKHPAPV